MAVVSIRGAKKCDASRSISDTLAQLRELADVDAIVCASPVETISGWALDAFHADDLVKGQSLRRLFASYLVRTHGAFGRFDPHEHVPEQRNILLDLRQLVPDDVFQASRICLEVFRPLHLHRRHVTGSLLCDGDRLLAWFAVFHLYPLQPQQRAVLEAAVPALQQRLAVDRHPDAGALNNAALGDIAAPAFIVTSSGQMVDVNKGGRAILSARRAEVSQSILAAFAHAPAALPVELTSLDLDGAPDHWLAIVRIPPEG
jgi:hypothetical protein